ncbi:MAG: DNA polymerase III subunit chi [Vitreoscilla sp.]|nr:DNA polymerase III subunit chi [Burkholderiales bacterium]MBP6336983.1 DNA polymerase III subunit chi [Vitreoscilla sp.]
MAEVVFLTGVDDKLAFACRLLRKKFREGSRVAVYGPAPLLTRLDQALWAEPQLDFVPHQRLRQAEAVPADAALTPIWLLEAAAPALQCDSAVNLGSDDVAALGSHGRVAEIVSLDEADRAEGQLRWKQYKAQGHVLLHRPQGAGAT